MLTINIQLANIWQNLTRQIVIISYLYWRSDRICLVQFDQILSFWGRELKSLRFHKRLHSQKKLLYF